MPQLRCRTGAPAPRDACSSAPRSEGPGRVTRRGVVPVPVSRPADARHARPASNRSFPAAKHRRSSRAHQTAAHRQGPWLPARHRFLRVRMNRSALDPPVSLTPEAVASKHVSSRVQELGISPVSQWRLTCLTGHLVSPLLRCHAGCCPRALGYRTSLGPSHARTGALYARSGTPGITSAELYSWLSLVG